MAFAPTQFVLSRAAKPADATGTFYIANSNPLALDGEIAIHSTDLPNTTNVNIVPRTFTTASGAFQEVVVTVPSSGLDPKEYAMTLAIMAKTPETLSVLETLDAKFDVSAEADANTTNATTVGSPTIGVVWRGIRIWPADADGFAIHTDDDKDRFIVSLAFGDLSANCDLLWSTSLYESRCTIPGTIKAGFWNVSITLDGDLFYASSVHIKCRDEFFEDTDTGLCYSCPSGTTCSNGATTSSMQLRPGYWRAGK